MTTKSQTQEIMDLKERVEILKEEIEELERKKQKFQRAADLLRTYSVSEPIWSLTHSDSSPDLFHFGSGNRLGLFLSFFQNFFN